MEDAMRDAALPLAIQCPADETALAEAIDLGLHRIQLRIGPEFPLDPETTTRAEIGHAAEQLARRGFEVVALGCYRNPLSPDLAERAAEIARLRQVMDMASLFGTDLIGVFAGRDPNRSLEDNLPIFREVWSPLADDAERLGVRLAFENCTMLRGDPPRGINMAFTPSILEAMFAAVPSAQLGIELDPSHLAKQWIDPVVFVESFGITPAEASAGTSRLERIFHVHAKDHETLPDQLQTHGRFDIRASRDRLPGHGQIDFPAFFRALRCRGYRDAVTFEPERGTDLPTGISAEDRFQALEGSIAYLRRALA